MAKLDREELSELIAQAQEFIEREVELQVSKGSDKKVTYVFSRIDSLPSKVATSDDGKKPKFNIPNGILTIKGGKGERKYPLDKIILLFKN